MGRKMNNMPAKKGKKDKNNPQIRGKAGLGRTRTKGRLSRQKERTKVDVKLERGEPVEQPQEERTRPEGWVSLAKRQEDRVAQAGGEEEQEEHEESRRAKRRRRKAGAEAQDEPKTDLLERSHIPQADLREGTVDLGPDDGEDDGGVLARHQLGAKKQATASYRPSFCSAGVCFRGSKQGQGSLWPRAAVRLAELQGAAELNGRTASCSSWDGGKERWLVRLDGGSEVKALKPSNLKLRAAQDVGALRPGSSVRILGLKGAAALNGEQATCISWDKEKERWLCRLQSSIERLLRPENLKLHGSQDESLLRVGSSVRLSGLQAAPELNGKLGTCLAWDEARHRWRVRLEGAVERLLKPENMEVESTPEELLVSPLVVQSVTFCKTQDKPEQLAQLLKRLRQEEKKSVRPRSLVVVFSHPGETFQAALDALHRAQLPCIALHGELNKAKRESLLATFQLDQKSIALVTDDASQGLKSEHLRCVVNYDFPRGLAQYGDRVRRVLRDGMEGWAYSLFTRESASLAQRLVSLLDGATASVDPALRQLAEERSQRAAAREKEAAAAKATAAPTGGASGTPGAEGAGSRKKARALAWRKKCKERRRQAPGDGNHQEKSVGEEQPASAEAPKEGQEEGAPAEKQG